MITAQQNNPLRQITFKTNHEVEMEFVEGAIERYLNNGDLETFKSEMKNSRYKYSELMINHYLRKYHLIK